MESKTIDERILEGYAREAKSSMQDQDTASVTTNTSVSTSTGPGPIVSFETSPNKKPVPPQHARSDGSSANAGAAAAGNTSEGLRGRRRVGFAGGGSASSSSSATGRSTEEQDGHSSKLAALEFLTSLNTLRMFYDDHKYTSHTTTATRAIDNPSGGGGARMVEASGSLVKDGMSPLRGGITSMGTAVARGRASEHKPTRKSEVMIIPQSSSSSSPTATAKKVVDIREAESILAQPMDLTHIKGNGRSRSFHYGGRSLSGHGQGSVSAGSSSRNQSVSETVVSGAAMKKRGSGKGSVFDGATSGHLLETIATKSGRSSSAGHVSKQNISAMLSGRQVRIGLSLAERTQARINAIQEQLLKIDISKNFKRSLEDKGERIPHFLKKVEANPPQPSNNAATATAAGAANVNLSSVSDDSSSLSPRGSDGHVLRKTTRVPSRPTSASAFSGPGYSPRPPRLTGKSFSNALSRQSSVPQSPLSTSPR